MTAKRPDVGLYVHIPFCAAKCSYCDFYSLAHREDKMDDYCAALAAHLREVAPRMAGQQVDTVYFGGGTPSYLGPKRLAALLKTIRKGYRLTADAEITLEANPDSAGVQPPVPGGPGHGRRDAPPPGPHPHGGAGAAGGVRRPGRRV